MPFWNFSDWVAFAPFGDPIGEVPKGHFPQGTIFLLVSREVAQHGANSREHLSHELRVVNVSHVVVHDSDPPQGKRRNIERQHRWSAAVGEAFLIECGPDL